MKDKLRILIVILVIFISFSISVYADFAVSLDLNNSQTDNLMSDSSAIDSPIRSGALGLKYYPVSQLELSGTLKHTMYDKMTDTTIRGMDTTEIITDISNSLYGFRASWIPFKVENKTNLYFNTSFDRILYKKETEEYDNSILGFSASIGYKYRPTIHLRAGTKITSTNYLNEDSVDGNNIQYELFTGINFSLPGSNSLDIEGGFGITSYRFIDAIKYPDYPDNPYMAGDSLPNQIDEEGKFQLLYVSPRLSRPIGSKTGISLTYSYKHFLNIEDAVVLGYSTSFLSPWSSFYDGSSIILRIKTYLIPKMVISAGTGYWDKKYLRTIGIIMVHQFEDFYLPGFSPPKDTPFRKDWLTRVYIDAKRPFNIYGILIEPSVSIDYKKNRSTSNTYNYLSTTFSFGLSLSDSF